jgi:quercetin dioxygenase-like cupin family protein
VNLAYTAATMNIVFAFLALFAAAASTQQRAPIPADEVTLRHKIYGNERFAVFLLDIPPGQATLAHRHSRDMLSVFVSGGRTRASFSGAPTVEDTFAVGDVRFRAAGFTHSTENVGTERFTSVIFEFATSQGERVPATQPTTHTCNPGSTIACVDVKPLFCTVRFCVDDVRMAPRAVSNQPAATQDRMLVAVSDYAFREERPGAVAAVHTRKSGEVENLTAGAASRWTNVSAKPAHLIIVSFR